MTLSSTLRFQKYDLYYKVGIHNEGMDNASKPKNNLTYVCWQLKR